MRIDIDERDNWTPEQCAINLECQIFVDGKEVKYCTVADEEEGYVIKLKTDENGKLVRDGDDVARERITGKVEIRSPARRTKRG